MHGSVSRIQIYWNTCTVEVAVNPCSAVGQRIDFTALLPAISTNPRILLTISTTDTTSSNRWLSLFNINNRSIFWHEVMGVVDVGKHELDGTGKLENDEYEYDVWSLRVLTIDPFCSSRKYSIKGLSMPIGHVMQGAWLGASLHTGQLISGNRPRRHRRESPFQGIESI